jgi:type II secretory pathway pseudopilin PulG
MTVIEALLVTVIFLGALSLIGTLFLYGSRFSRGGSQRTDLAQARMKAAESLRRAMAGSYQSGNTAFYLTPDPERRDLAISLITTLDAQGRAGWDDVEQKPLFRGYLVYFRDASDDTLKTFRVDIAETSIASPLGESEVRTRMASDPAQTLAVSVDTFQLFSPQDGSVRGAWANPAGLRLIQGSSRGTPTATEIPFKFPTL